jgi:hypothetical protein
MGRAVGRIAIGCGLLGLLTGLGPSAGCGGGMRYTIDDAVLEPIPTEQRQAVLQARQELEHAEGEERAARSELEEVDRDQDLAAEENQQAELEVEKAVAQQEGAHASRNDTEASAAAHSKALADLGLDASQAKLNWLAAKRNWTRQVLVAAKAHVGAAAARVELEKARLAQQRGVRPTSSFNPADYESQWEGKSSTWRSEKSAADSEARTVQRRALRWQELTSRQQALRGG